MKKSSRYNYYERNRLHRGPQVAANLKGESRQLPRATGAIAMDPQIRGICPVGGIIAFSAEQMHSSVLNISGKTRFSIDLRTVNVGTPAPVAAPGSPTRRGPARPCATTSGWAPSAACPTR